MLQPCFYSCLPSHSTPSLWLHPSAFYLALYSNAVKEAEKDRLISSFSSHSLSSILSSFSVFTGLAVFCSVCLFFVILLKWLADYLKFLLWSPRQCVLAVSRLVLFEVIVISNRRWVPNYLFPMRIHSRGPLLTLSKCLPMILCDASSTSLL